MPDLQADLLLHALLSLLFEAHTAHSSLQPHISVRNSCWAPVSRVQICSWPISYHVSPQDLTLRGLRLPWE
jgi:hypothetical protein